MINSFIRLKAEAKRHVQDALRYGVTYGSIKFKEKLCT